MSYGGAPADQYQIMRQNSMMQPNMQANMQPNMQPGMNPGMSSGMQPGMQPPGMQQNMHPGMQANMPHGMQPNMQHAMANRMVMQGSVASQMSAGGVPMPNAGRGGMMYVAPGTAPMVNQTPNQQQMPQPGFRMPQPVMFSQQQQMAAFQALPPSCRDQIQKEPDQLQRQRLFHQILANHNRKGQPMRPMGQIPGNPQMQNSQGYMVPAMTQNGQMPTMMQGQGMGMPQMNMMPSTTMAPNGNMMQNPQISQKSMPMNMQMQSQMSSQMPMQMQEQLGPQMPGPMPSQMINQMPNVQQSQAPMQAPMPMQSEMQGSMMQQNQNSMLAGHLSSQMVNQISQQSQMPPSVMNQQTQHMQMQQQMEAKTMSLLASQNQYEEQQRMMIQKSPDQHPQQVMHSSSSSGSLSNHMQPNSNMHPMSIPQPQVSMQQMSIPQEHSSTASHDIPQITHPDESASFDPSSVPVTSTNVQNANRLTVPANIGPSNNSEKTNQDSSQPSSSVNQAPPISAAQPSTEEEKKLYKAKLKEMNSRYREPLFRIIERAKIDEIPPPAGLEKFLELLDEKRTVSLDFLSRLNVSIDRMIESHSPRIFFQRYKKRRQREFDRELAAAKAAGWPECLWPKETARERRIKMRERSIIQPQRHFYKCLSIQVPKIVRIITEQATKEDVLKTKPRRRHERIKPRQKNIIREFEDFLRQPDRILLPHEPSSDPEDYQETKIPYACCRENNAHEDELVYRHLTGLPYKQKVTSTGADVGLPQDEWGHVLECPGLPGMPAMPFLMDMLRIPGVKELLQVPGVQEILRIPKVRTGEITLTQEEIMQRRVELSRIRERVEKEWKDRERLSGDDLEEREREIRREHEMRREREDREREARGRILERGTKTEQINITRKIYAEKYVEPGIILRPNDDQPEKKLSPETQKKALIAVKQLAKLMRDDKIRQCQAQQGTSTSESSDVEMEDGTDCISCGDYVAMGQEVPIPYLRNFKWIPREQRIWRMSDGAFAELSSLEIKWSIENHNIPACYFDPICQFSFDHLYFGGPKLRVILSKEYPSDNSIPHVILDETFTPQNCVDRLSQETRSMFTKYWRCMPRITLSEVITIWKRACNDAYDRSGYAGYPAPLAPTPALPIDKVHVPRPMTPDPETYNYNYDCDYEMPNIPPPAPLLPLVDYPSPEDESNSDDVDSLCNIFNTEMEHDMIQLD